MIWRNIFERSHRHKGNVKTPRTTQNPGTISRSQISPHERRRPISTGTVKSCTLPSQRTQSSLAFPRCQTRRWAHQPTGGGGRGRKGTAKAPGASPGRCQGPSEAETTTAAGSGITGAPGGSPRPAAPSGGPGQGRALTSSLSLTGTPSPSSSSATSVCPAEQAQCSAVR